MKIVKLGDISKSSGSKTSNEANLPVYSVTKHNGFVLSDEYFKKQVFSKDLSKYKFVRKGEFAYATIHLDEGSIGIAPEDCLISPMYTVFRIDESQVEPEFLIRFLKSPTSLARYANLGNGSVHRRRSIPYKSISQLEVPLPDLAEQRRIAAILDKADAIRQKRHQALEHLDSLIQSIFHEMFGDAHTWTERWPMTTIGKQATLVQYGTAAKAGPTGKYPMLRMGNLTDSGTIDTSDLKFIDFDEEDASNFLLHENDMLFNRTNSLVHVGKTSVVRTETDCVFAGYLVRVRFTDPNFATFASTFLNGPEGKSLRRKSAKAAINQANISASQMKSWSIANPPAPLLQQFVDQVALIQDFKTKYIESTSEINTLKGSLAASVFRN